MPARIHEELNSIRLTIMVAMLFTALAAAVFRTPPIVFMAALLWSAPLMVTLLGSIANRHIHVTRHFSSVGTVGDTIGGRFTVSNRARLPMFLVHVRCGEVFAAVGDGAADNARETLVPAVIAVGTDEHVAPLLRPREEIIYHQQWTLMHRGVYSLPPARAGALDPAGLFTRLDPKTPWHEITVLPRPLKIDRLGFQGGHLRGMHSPRHAVQVVDAMDFHGVRSWHPGDAIRRVHWKSTARTGQLHVVEWEDDISADLTVILDTQLATMAGLDANNSFETAITLASTIAVHLLEKGYKFQFFCWNNSSAGAAQRMPVRQSRFRDLWHAPVARNYSACVQQFQGRNAASIAEALRGMAKLQPVPVASATLAQLVKHAAPSIPTGRNILVIAPTLADIKGALAPIAGPGRERCQVLALDSASFSVDVPGKQTNADNPIGFDRRSLSAQADVRVVKRGDSLTAALERPFSGRN